MRIQMNMYSMIQFCKNKMCMGRYIYKGGKRVSMGKWNNV